MVASLLCGLLLGLSAADKLEEIFQADVRSAIAGPAGRSGPEARHITQMLQSSTSHMAGMVSEDARLIGRESNHFSLWDVASARFLARQDLFRFKAPANDLSRLRLVSISQETYVPDMRGAPMTFGRVHIVWSDRKILVLASPKPELLSGSISGKRNVLFVGLADLKARGAHPNREKSIQLQSSENISTIVVDSYSGDNVLLRIGRDRGRDVSNRVEAYRLNLRTFRLSTVSTSQFKYPQDSLHSKTFSNSTYKWKHSDREWQTFRQGPDEVSTKPYALAAVSKNRRFALVVHQETLDAWVLEARK